MNPSPEGRKGSEQCQDDCTGEKFVRKRAVSQIDQKQWGTKRDLDRFYINLVLQAQTALVHYTIQWLNCVFHFYMWKKTENWLRKKCTVLKCTQIENACKKSGRLGLEKVIKAYKSDTKVEDFDSKNMSDDVSI